MCSICEETDDSSKFGRYRQYLIFDLLKEKANPFYQKMLERQRIFEFK